MSCESGGTCLRAFVQAAATVATKVPQVRFQADALVRVGVASGQALSARAAGWVLVGHERHHLGIVREQYLG